MKKILLWCLSVLMVLSVGIAVGCKDKDKDGESSEVSVSYAVSLNTYTLEMDLFGGEQQLQATAFKDNAITDGNIVWESADTNIVQVQNGRLVPVGVGETVVTAYYEEAEAKCKISVKSDSVPVLRVDAYSLKFIHNVSSSYALDAYILFLGEEYRDEAEIEYSIPTEGETVAKVDASGVVTPVGLGETELTVTATFRNYDGIGMRLTIPVAVCQDLEVAVALSQDAPEKLYKQKVVYGGAIYNNQTGFTYNVRQMQENGLVDVSNATVEWKTSDETVATVSNQGVLTAVDAGTVEVWCEYAYNGIMNASNKLSVNILPYAVVEEKTEKVLLLDKSNPSKLPDAAALFGENDSGRLAGIYLNTANILQDGTLAISEYNDGVYAFDVVNENGYAFAYTGAVVSITAKAEDVEFGVLVGEKSSNIRYYNLVLPAIDEIRDLMIKGYKGIRFDYNYKTENTFEKVVVSSKYTSELQKSIEANKNGSFTLCLSDIYDRYDELDEFVRSEYAFNILENSGKLSFNDCSVTKETPETYVDFRLDRYTSMTGFTITNDVEMEGVVAQVAAQATIKANGKATLQSMSAVSKEVTEQWLDDGYNVYRVKYYLAYDEAKMTKKLLAYSQEAQGTTKIGESVPMVANQWTEMTFSLGRWYAIRGNSALFTMDVATADDGSEMEYTLYIASIEAEKDATVNTVDNIRMYAGYPVEMWTPTGEIRGVNEYDKQLGDKTAHFYTRVEQTKYAWGCYINFFTALNITPEQLKALKNAGYTTLDFAIYAKTSVGADTKLVMNPEQKDVYSELHKYTLKDGEWTTVSIDLEFLIAYYDDMNGCRGGKHFWSINPFTLNNGSAIVYELGVGEITPGGKN